MRLSLVKTAVDDSSDRLLAREARWLRELASVSALEGQVPRLLEEGTGADGRRFLVMAIPPGVGEMRGGETRAFTVEHARFLASLGKARFRVTDFELSGCGDWLHRALGRVEAFAPGRDAALLQAAFHDCETALLYWTGPYVVAQGDFAPWNIRTLGPQLFVSDWGHTRTDASPLDDVLHYLMIQRALTSRPVTGAFLQSAMQRAQAFARQAYPEWTWRAPVIGALTLVYLLGATLHRTLARGTLDRADPMTGLYLRLLERRASWMPE
jgi:hypothetical protein